MKVIMVMYDSLNRRYLPNYGCGLTQMPNFKRLGERTATFENSYVGSLPCMPARRELHTGRLNFLHRGWGPLEPFDDSMPEILKNHGIYSHLISDHQHYWEDGGATYHTRYSSWEISRGQEGDPWKGFVGPVKSSAAFGMLHNPIADTIQRQDEVNRRFIKEEKDFPQVKTFNAGLEFIERNKDNDNWFLQIETFDPHEPFFSPAKYRALYGEEKDFPYDWPPYAPAVEDEHMIAGIRKKYMALLSMCDYSLGRVLDAMDRHNLWRDTMLIVNTDHGYLLGEHHWWAKSVMPNYNELVHTPLFIWDPRSAVKGERRTALVQSIDLAPTVLEYFGLKIPKDMQGFALRDTIASDKKVRDYALFGFHGAQINITDGRYVYMRAPVSMNNQPLAEYTLMPTRMRTRMSPEELADITLCDPFEFTKGCRTLKVRVREDNTTPSWFRYGNRLYDLKQDPEQLHPIDCPEKELSLISEMLQLMEENDAPTEQYIRMGIWKGMTKEQLLEQRREREACFQYAGMEQYQWEEEAFWAFAVLAQATAGRISTDALSARLKESLGMENRYKVRVSDVYELMRKVTANDRQAYMQYLIYFQSRME